MDKAVFSRHVTFSLWSDEVVIWCEIITSKVGGRKLYVIYKVKLVLWEGITNVIIFIDISEKT